MLFRNIILIFASLTALHSDESVASEDFIHFTSPNCKNKPFVESIYQNDGIKRSFSKGNMFCTKEDFKDLNSSETSVFMFSELKKILSDKTIETIELSYYYFNEFAIAEMFCDLFEANNFKLTIYTQNSEDPYKFPSNVQNHLDKCGIKPKIIPVGCDVFSDAECELKGINTNHIKLLRINRARTVTHLFGSGNINQSLYSNLDHWESKTVAKGSYFDVKHQCLFNALSELNKSPSYKGKVTNFYLECIKNAPQASSYEVFVMPFEYNEFKERVSDILNESINLQENRDNPKVDVSFQSLKDREIRDGILEAINRGADVRVLLDDYWYYHSIGITSIFTNNSDYENYVKPIIESHGVKVRFCETNHNAKYGDFRNVLHHRTIIYQGLKDAVITGASHFKYGSLKHNLENQYIIDSPSSIEKYLDEFEKTWKKCLPSSSMLISYPDFL